MKEILGESIEIVAALPGKYSFLKACAQLSKDKGSDAFAGAQYLPPFQSWRQSAAKFLPLVEASYVTSDSGTGLVHSAPAHGMEDYQAFKQLYKARDAEAAQLPSLVDGDGLFQRGNTAFIDDKVMQRLEGKSVLGDGAQETILLLEEQGLLAASRKIRHKYPYDWKTKQPVIVRATPQWFANLDHIKDIAIEALRNVNFVPVQGGRNLSSLIASLTPDLQVAIAWRPLFVAGQSGASLDRGLGVSRFR